MKIKLTKGNQYTPIQTSVSSVESL